ncbi:MAG: septation protein SepH, partial [Leucobacter sp.]
MDELRFVRREDRSLIVADDAGEEFRLLVDDAMLSELRHLGRKERGEDTSKVRPREIQALIRAGRSRAQVAKETGLDEADIERYEEPVLAERRYILERAHAVPVRTDATDDADQRFGEVIAERLIALGADTSEWESWRDEEAGWMISLEFISHDVAHRAVWSFEHRKAVLSPVNPDAVNLSKQGTVGDRLIPKLRAVDDAEKSGRFDSDAFDTSQLPIGAGDVEADPEPSRTPDA